MPRGFYLPGRFCWLRTKSLKAAQVIQNQGVVQVVVQLLHGSWPHSQRTYLRVERSFVQLSPTVSHYSDLELKYAFFVTTPKVENLNSAEAVQ